MVGPTARGGIEGAHGGPRDLPERVPLKQLHIRRHETPEDEPALFAGVANRAAAAPAERVAAHLDPPARRRILGETGYREKKTTAPGEVPQSHGLVHCVL